MIRNILLAICLATLGCGRNDEEVQLIQFSREVTLITKINGSGGALGEESYRIYYRHNGQDIIFFEGVNPKDFSLKKISVNKIAVRFCDGTVRLAQPIFLGPPYKELVHLELDLAC